MESGLRYEYALKDHLGNSRVMFSDKNDDGIVQTVDDETTPEVDENEMLQQSHYYPFGMQMTGAFGATQGVENKYLYNGKELNEDFGLNWSDYGARWYDAGIGRWNGVDPLASSMPEWSPYNYVFGNPISLTDPTGLAPECEDCPDYDYLDVADHVYKSDLAVGDVSELGWTVAELVSDDKSQFKGAVYTKTIDGVEEYILAAEGTVFLDKHLISTPDGMRLFPVLSEKNIKDIGADIKQAFGLSTQYAFAIESADGYVVNYPGLSFSGHSLGGGLASAMALKTGSKAVTFNAAALSNRTKNKHHLNSSSSNNITAFIVKGEMVDHLQHRVIGRAEGNIIPLTYYPSGYSRIPVIKEYQRGKAHTTGAVKDAYLRYISNF